MSRRAEVIRRQCDNPRCRKWYDVLARLVRQGRGLHCHPACSRNHLTRFKWYVCLQCGLSFRRTRHQTRARKPKFCCALCYNHHRAVVQVDSDWRAFPLGTYHY